MPKFKKNLIILLFILISVVILAGIFFNNQSIVDNNQLSIIKPKITACPTFFNFLESQSSENYLIINTPSTASGLSLLSTGQADYVLSGRPLKPTEGNYQQIFLTEQGYSFLGSVEQTFYIDELINYPIYTNLDLSDLQVNLGLNNLIFIDDIYLRPEPSLAITSWDNTDYARAEITHILNRDGSRYLLSRTPILYCQICGKEIIDLLTGVSD